MNYDQEFTAMRVILKALDKLDDDAKLRVMKFIVELQDAAINVDPIIKEMEAEHD